MYTGVFFVLAASIAAVKTEYILPCTVGSLRSGKYMVNGSYFCTEPIKTLYNSNNIWTPTDNKIDTEVYGNYEIYKYMNSVNATPIDELFKTVKHQPCNCYNQRIQWKSEILEIKIENKISQGFVQKIQQRDNTSNVKAWNPYIDGTPCGYAQLGYTWAVASEELPDPLILTIPPGNLKSVIKTGAATDQFLVKGANPVPCGIATRDVYQSVYIPSGTINKPNVSIGTSFFERPGSMPISDYCLFTKPQLPNDWSSLTQTQRVFKATVLRLAAAVNTVKQCVDGTTDSMMQNIFLLSGFRNNNGQYSMGTGIAVSEYFNEIQQEATSAFGITKSFSNDNSIQLCATKAIVNTIQDAVHSMNTWTHNAFDRTGLFNTYDYGNDGLSSFKQYNKPTGGQGSAGLAGDKTIIITNPTLRYSGIIDIKYDNNRLTPTFSNKDDLFENSGGTFTASTGRAFMCNPMKSDYSTIVAIQNYEGYYATSNFQDKIINRNDWTAFKNNVMFDSASLNGGYGNDAQNPGLLWPCSNDNYLKITIACLSTCQTKTQKSGKIGCNEYRNAWESPGKGLFFDIYCGKVSTPPTYSFPTVPTTTDYSSQEGKQGLVTQLNAIFAYYHILDKMHPVEIDKGDYYYSEIDVTRKRIDQFVEFLSSSASKHSKDISIKDLVPSDFLSTQGTYSNNKVSYGIFDTDSRGNLTLESDLNTFKYNPFMPNGVTTHLPDSCLNSETSWMDPDDNTIINIAKPGTLEYFTSDQVQSEYGSFLSTDSISNGYLTHSGFGNGFVTNLLAFYNAMELNTDTTLVTSWRNAMITDAELVGYSSTISKTDFYDALLDENCNPKNNPMESFYFAPRSQDVRNRRFQHVHVPMFNKLISPSALDTVHCQNVSIGDNSKILERKEFLDPGYTGNDPPGLSQDQLNAWCATFSREECTGFNETDQSYAMCSTDLTNQSSTCKLRKYNYGSLTEIPGYDMTYDVTFSQCNYWNSELDYPIVCQRQDMFTGCVLVQTRNVQGNSTASESDEFNGASVRVPNSFERLVATTPSSPLRYYATMHYLFFTLTTSDTLNKTTDLDNLDDCSCRYINENGTKTDLDVSIQTNYSIIDFEKSQRKFITQRNKQYFHNIIQYTLEDPITLTIPPVKSIGIHKDAVYDYNRAAIRCNCANDELFLANNAFTVLNDEGTSVFTNHENNTQNISVLSISCVPFNEKIKFEDAVTANAQSSNIVPLISKGNVYKTRPVDCNALSYRTSGDTKLMSLYKEHCTNQINGYGGICTDFKNNNNNGGCDFANNWYANTGSTIPLTTHWSQSIPETDSFASYFFDGNTTNTSCGKDSTNCGIMMDKTYMVPCGILAETTVPECSKPQLQLIYPAFDQSSPDSIGEAVKFPSYVWKWNQGLPAFDSKTFEPEQNLKNVFENSRFFTEAYWNRQLTMVHYCDTYFNEHVFCENDPISATQRKMMCREKNASIIYAGTVLNDFLLQDICPFVFNTSNTRECFVFPGSPKFGSIRSIMAELESRDKSISDITFYYVPFSLEALKNIYMNAAFGDTLITNRFSANESSFINDTNKDEIGINAQLLSNPLLKALKDQRAMYPEKQESFFIENQQGVCNRQIPMSKTVIELYFKAIQYCLNPASGLYEFVVVQTSANQTIQNVVYLSKDKVFPPITEAGTAIRSNNIKIQPAINSEIFPLYFSTRLNTNIFECTRFIVDAYEFSISNITFNQTNCQHLHESNQIPIVFTGDYAISANLSNLVSIDAPVMTAIYGGSSRYGVYSKFIDGNNMEINSFSMHYSENSNLSPIMQNNAAVLGKTVGTISANSCVENHCVLSYKTPENAIATCNIHYCGCNLTTAPDDCVDKSTTQCSEHTAAKTHIGFEISNNVDVELYQSWVNVADETLDSTRFIHNGNLFWTSDDNNNIVVQSITSDATRFTKLKNDDGVCRGDILVLGSACYLTAITAQKDLYEKDQCIAVRPNNSLFLTDCQDKTGQYKNTLLLTYTDIIHQRVHQSGNPFMCFTARNQSSTVVLEPCKPCDIGTEIHLPCASDTELSQWITEENSTRPLLTIHESVQGTCKTLNKTSGNTSFLPCNTCLWEKELFAIGTEKRLKYKPFCKTAIGIERFACNSLSSAEIYTTSGTSPTELCKTFSARDTLHELDATKFGLGAILYCNNDYTPKWINRGYGYFENDEINIPSLPPVQTQTKKIIIQPYQSTGFNIASQGYQVINISTYTGFFGKAYEANIFATPLRPNNAFWTVNIILGIINGSLVFLHIALTLYEKELKERFASPAIE